MNLQPDMIGEGWLEVLDGNSTGRDIFSRHYTYKHRRSAKPPLIMARMASKSNRLSISSA